MQGQELHRYIQKRTHYINERLKSAKEEPTNKIEGEISKDQLIAMMSE